MTVCARHRFSLEVAFWLQKATAKLLNDAFYAISCCEIKKLPWSDPGLYALTTTTQPLWNPAQRQSEQRQLIPRDSFVRFLPRLSGKTIFSESHSGQQSILLGMKVVSRILKRFAT
jgi:hypothetical protein